MISVPSFTCLVPMDIKQKATKILRTAVILFYTLKKYYHNKVAYLLRYISIHHFWTQNKVNLTPPPLVCESSVLLRSEG